MTRLAMCHTVGNANVRAAAQALLEGGLLAEFWITLAWNPESWLNRVLPAALLRQCQRRALSPALLACTRTRPWRELGRLVAGGLGWTRPLRHEAGMFSLDAINRDLDGAFARRLRRLAARGGVTGVYAYEDIALATFSTAAELGLRRIYDLPSAHWREFAALIAVEEAERPEWAPTLIGNQDSAAKNAGKDEELRLATTIIVASDYTRRTLAAAPGVTAPIHVVPYGAPPAAGERAWERGGPLRALSVGSLTQRKGLSFLFAAAAALPREVALTVIGSRPVACPALDRALAAHRWLPSLPHGEVLAEMRRHEVLVLPSLHDGFGLVIAEAMSQGLVVITTSNTAGPDLISDGEDGFIVPIRDHAAIVERLALLVRDRARVEAMGRRAQARVAQLTWERYRAGVLAIASGARRA